MMKRFIMIILALAVFCSLSFTALGNSPTTVRLNTSVYNDKAPKPDQQGPNEPQPKKKVPKKKKRTPKQDPKKKPKEQHPGDEQQPRDEKK